MVKKKLLPVVKLLEGIVLQEGGSATKMDPNLTKDSHGACHVIFI